MNKKDRNKRFIEVFNHLVKEQKIIKSGRKKQGQDNLSTFAEKLGTYPWMIKRILDGSRNFTDSMAGQLCKVFDVSKEYLLLNNGEMFKSSIQQAKSLVSDTVNALGLRQNINMVPQSVFAGDGFESQEIGNNAGAFGIPGLHGDYLAFTVDGTSMEPLVRSGDLVICNKDYERLEDIKEHVVYVVVENGVLRLKKIKVNQRPNDYPMLNLISINDVEHAPIEIEAHENIRIHKMAYRLTQNISC